MQTALTVFQLIMEPVNLFYLVSCVGFWISLLFYYRRQKIQKKWHHDMKVSIDILEDLSDRVHLEIKELEALFQKVKQSK